MRCQRSVTRHPGPGTFGIRGGFGISGGFGGLGISGGTTVTGGGAGGGETVTVPGGTVGGTTVVSAPDGVITTVVSVGEVVVVVVVVVVSSVLSVLSPLQATAHMLALMAASPRMAWQRAFRLIMSAPPQGVVNPGLVLVVACGPSTKPC
jgi:hypothetical protein